MFNPKNNDMSNDIMIADILLRITTLEKLLVSKGILSQEEINTTMDDLSSKILKSILEKSNIPGDHDEILKNMKDDKSKN